MRRNGIYVGLIPDPLLSFVGRFRKIKAKTLLVQSNQTDLARIISMIRSESIIPYIDKIFDIHSYNQAYMALEHGSVQGKIVVSFDQSPKSSVNDVGTKNSPNF